MKQIGTAIENFAFKAFDFSGRATLLEYWVMMPLVWGVIIFLAIGDVTEFWEFLLRREVPPMNPLYWDSIVVFFLTLIPRITLTVRRLHDSGKSGKWVKLPVITVISGFWLVMGLGVALLTLNGPGQDIGMAALVMAIVAGSMLGDTDFSVWSAIFSAAAAANAIGWDAFVQMGANLMPAAAPEINVNRGIPSGGAENNTMMLVALLMLATPFISAFLHIFFMISPSKPDHDLDPHGPISGASLRKQGETSENPFAGYKYLYAQSEDEQAAQKAAAREEIKSLYRERVLGGGSPT